MRIILENVDLFQMIHRNSWIFVFTLFFIVYALYGKKKSKAANMTQMILRFFFIIMLFSGVSLVIAYNFDPFYVTKGLFAITMMGLMESSTVRRKKGQQSKLAFISGSILLITVVLMGFRVIHF
ncbi:DUF1516 family protein [Thalassobacillus pellis]|uniref:DUF1516 family protein n=1 Tax=Thalassobacillus pellis TaxID=748008 RepID=UPI0019603434|nr:DUF1516 family protein [Thalassobacillus pellis]MBM7553955.1 RsiW-degrading membrane proteinase PrsW (M82 family) [Thalassobacillus pellis]